MRFSKQLLAVFVDFLFLTVIFAILTFSIMAVKILFYPKGESAGVIICITESMPLRFEDRLSKNDIVYDTLSKRKVGEIKELQAIYSKDRVKFIIKIDAKFKPKSESFRTKNLWFRYHINTEDYGF